MVRLFLQTLLILLFTSSLSAQIITFNFNTDPFLQVSSNDANITVSDITLSSGTITTNVTTGTYFTDEPYIEEAGGWTEISQTDAKYFYITVSANTGYTFSITNISFEFYRTSAGPSEIGFAIDDSNLFSMIAPDSELATVNETVTGQTGLTSATIKIQGWAGGTGTFRTDNLIIDGNVNPIPVNDADSELVIGTDTEPSTISSIQNDDTNPFQVLDFTFADAGTSDGLPTIINQLTIVPGINNTITDWQDAIEGAKLYGPDIDASGISGTLTANSILFSASPLISVGDGNNETYQLRIYLKTDLSSINDNDVLDFELDYNNVLPDQTGSSFGSGVVSSGGIALTIDASELRFQLLASSVFTNQDFSTIIEATDVNGNIDTDFTGQVTLSLNSGTGNLSAVSGLSKNASAGVAAWTDLQYDTGEIFSLLANSSGLTNNSTFSQNITAKNSTSELVDDFEDGDLVGWENISDWINSTSEPINGSYSLKHNLNEVTGESYISHNLAGLDLASKSVVWRFNLKNGDWDPSGTNAFWFYLLANENDLTSPTVDGYVVGVDFEGTDDLLTLWKVTDGVVAETLITSNFNWNNSEVIGVEVIRSTSGKWVLNYYENSSFENAQVGGAAANSDYIFHDYCGLVFRYGTASRAGLLWLDDVSVTLDNDPPVVSSVYAVNATTLKVQFSEAVEQSAAENTGSYSIEGLSAPTSATLGVDETSIILSFSSAFEANHEYPITISDVEDISGNVMEESSYQFTYIPFVVENLYVLSQSELLLEFSNPVEQSSTETLTNYVVDNSIGNPLSANLTTDSTVQLTFGNFSRDVEYSLNISNIINENGEPISAADIQFVYYPGNSFDLVINELMVDVSPSPNVLPAIKYIELYNRSESKLDLSGWRIQVGDNALRNFENDILASGDYLILTPANNASDFEVYGNTMGILSESQLTGSGTSIILYNKEGELVDYVNYSDTWYGDEEKSEGGWSLEKIDANNFCGEESNWKASQDYKGGTPGKGNSVSETNDDTVPFELLRAEVLSSNKLALTFSKNLVESDALNYANYQLDDGINTVLFVQFSDTSRTTVILQFRDNFIDAQEQEIHVTQLRDFCGNTINDTTAVCTYYLISATAAFADSENFIRVIFSDEVEINTAQTVSNYLVSDGMGSPMAAYKHSGRQNEVFLEFPAAFSNGINYVLTVENITDLNGNPIKSADLPFSYFFPSANDLIINELMFNPRPEGFDFVEIYNKASMPVDLSKISLARRSDDGELESIKQLAEFNKMLKPGVFIAISADTAKTKLDYPAASYDKFWQIPVLPAFNDDEGTVVLLYGDSIIDEFSYNEEMHFDLITDDEGVSLERIDPLKPASDADNWHSAAGTAGYATPANQNSQFRQLSEGIDEDVVIEPETFSPDNDGYEDVLFIRYRFNEPGYVANVSIYDGKGRLVKRVASNELLATNGEFSWDGLQSNQSKARIGIYVVYFEVFNLQGEVKKTKKTCVLAGKLN